MYIVGFLKVMYFCFFFLILYNMFSVIIVKKVICFFLFLYKISCLFIKCFFGVKINGL